MRAIGIVKRVDGLGRLVIPKEIRRMLRIKEGDLLEILTDSGGKIILKKYSYDQELDTISIQNVSELSDTQKEQ